MKHYVNSLKHLFIIIPTNAHGTIINIKQ